MIVETAERTLVLSWSGVLMKLRDDRVALSDLDDALFYFGCVREYAFSPWQHLGGKAQFEAIFEKKPKRGLELHRQLMKMVEQAEQDSRVAWRDEVHIAANYPQLNELLARFGLPPIPFDEYRYFDVNLGHVEAAVEEHKLPYRLIC